MSSKQKAIGNLHFITTKYDNRYWTDLGFIDSYVANDSGFYKSYALYSLKNGWYITLLQLDMLGNITRIACKESGTPTTLSDTGITMLILGRTSVNIMRSL